MINTVKPLSTFSIEAKDILKDIFISVNNRNGYLTQKKLNIPIYFYRYIGIKQNSEEYYEDLKRLHQELSSIGSLYLQIKKSLPIIFKEELTNRTQDIWAKIGSTDNFFGIKSMLETVEVFPYVSNSTLRACIKNGFYDVLDLFMRDTDGLNPTKIKNFILKLINWIHEYVPVLLQEFDIENIGSKKIINPKVVFYGDIKTHEIYFLKYLALIGCDVLYINTLEDKNFFETAEKRLVSFLCRLEKSDNLKEYPECELVFKNQNVFETTHQSKSEPKRETKIDTKMEPESEHKYQTKYEQKNVYCRQEKSYEELSKLSASTVMIKTYDRNCEILGSGSGVIIDNNGLIVTNYHVIKDGVYFGVIFEGMDEYSQIETYTIINADIPKDLALIKLNMSTVPIEINQEDDLIRGQKVVAIGSPLGLMNTFSEGIISGFRKEYRCEFIQTTAPMSPGSSGGALLNLYGELIGIASAGYIYGQNINLAVPSKFVLDLLRLDTTEINQEIIYKCSVFIFENIKLCFDGFFNPQNSNGYMISLYQSRNDKTNFTQLLKNINFVRTIENYYLDIINSIAEMHNIHKYHFELGAQGNMFSYSYDNGRIYEKKWGKI